MLKHHLGVPARNLEVGWDTDSIGKINVLFDRKFDAFEPFVTISRSDLARILSNLLTNSIEACDPEGNPRVSVSVATSDGYITVQVVDDGCGISLESQEKLFHFTYTTKGEARGQGLKNCQNLVQQSGSEIKLVSSKLGEGSIFELKLSRCPTPAWFINRIQLSNKSVLVVVDDEGEIYEFWVKTIAERFGDMTLLEECKPKLLQIASPTELRQNKDGCLERGTLFLVDYKYKDDETTTGVSLIEELGLKEKAILVTRACSHY